MYPLVRAIIISYPVKCYDGNMGMLICLPATPQYSHDGNNAHIQPKSHIGHCLRITADKWNPLCSQQDISIESPERACSGSAKPLTESFRYCHLQKVGFKSSVGKSV